MVKNKKVLVLEALLSFLKSKAFILGLLHWDVPFQILRTEAYKLQNIIKNSKRIVFLKLLQKWHMTFWQTTCWFQKILNFVTGYRMIYQSTQYFMLIFKMYRFISLLRIFGEYCYFDGQICPRVRKRGNFDLRNAITHVTFNIMTQSHTILELL